VRIKDSKGNVTEYYDRSRPATPEQMAKAKRATWTVLIVTTGLRMFICHRIGG
jgi:hypothetical protein